MCNTKFCRACNQTKLKTDFHKKQEYPDGRYPRCIICVKDKIYLPEVIAITEGEKICSTCNVSKDISFFSKRNNRKSGLQPSCKECCKERQKPRCTEKVREYDLNRIYGITKEEFEELLRKQGNCCAICNINQDKLEGNKKYLCVDHCHESGVIRGLLCDSCNRGIGLLKDSPNIILKAYNYLKN